MVGTGREKQKEGRPSREITRVVQYEYYCKNIKTVSILCITIMSEAVVTAMYEREIKLP